MQSDSTDKFVIKPFQSVFEKKYENHSIYICLGYHHLLLKQKLIDKLLNNNYKLPNLMHTSVIISEYAKIGVANVFFSGATIDMFSSIGNGNVLYNQTCIAHEVNIENCNFFAPSVTICGNTNIGNSNFFGARVVVANNVIIGNENKIGIGSVITKNITSNISGVGFPFRVTLKELEIK